MFKFNEKGNRFMAIMKTMDGNEAAAYASYAFIDAACIYPITPSSPMAEWRNTWMNGLPQAKRICSDRR